MNNWDYEKTKTTLVKWEEYTYLASHLPKSKGASLGNIRVMKEFFQTSDPLSWGTRAAFAYNILRINLCSCWKEGKSWFPLCMVGHTLRRDSSRLVLPPCCGHKERGQLDSQGTTGSGPWCMSWKEWNTLGNRAKALAKTRVCWRRLMFPWGVITIMMINYVSYPDFP